MKKAAIIIAIIASTGAFAQGWIPTTAGTYDYLDTVNWTDGEVNGVFGGDLTISGQQNINFTGDWTGSLDIGSTISGKLYFQSSGGPFTVTLDDDLRLTPAAMNADVTFGNSADSTAANALNFDLGGSDRTVFMSGTRWIFSNRITNGGLVFDGTGTFTFRSHGGSDGDITVGRGLTLATGYTSSDKTDIEETRAADLTLERAILRLNSQNVNVVDNFTGTLRVTSNEPGNSIIYPRALTSGKTAAANFGSLAIDDGGLLLVRGAKVGGDAKVFFQTAPETVGGVIPKVIGEPADSDNAGQSGSYNQTFYGYSQENGIYALDLATGYETAIPVGGEPVNLLVNHATTNEISSPVAVNSLYLRCESTTDAFAAIVPADGAEDATVTVESGMVLIGYPAKSGNYKYPTIGVPLDFGSRHGTIIFAGGKRSQINGALKGSGGVTFTIPLATTAALPTSGLVLGGDSGASTYTGPTYIQGHLNAGTTDFLPHGNRTGDVTVNGTLTADNFTINGLNGKGSVTRASSGGKTMTLGDNDANGDFNGTLTITDNGGTLNKIGAGTQRFGGTLTFQKEINVNAGTVVIDGTVASGTVNVAAGAAIGGCGTITPSVTFAGNATLKVGVEGRALKGPLRAASVSAAEGAEITVDVESADWKGQACILKVTGEGATLNGLTFKKGANCGDLSLSPDGTELRMASKRGFVILFR